jgi:hypothetical protein
MSPSRHLLRRRSLTRKDPLDFGDIFFLNQCFNIGNLKLCREREKIKRFSLFRYFPPIFFLSSRSFPL